MTTLRLGGLSLRRSLQPCAAGLLLASLSAPASTASPQGVGLDLGASKLHVTQSVQSSNTPLVGRRSTMVRVPVGILAGALLPGEQVDGILRVFLGGVESADSPIFSANGPLTPPLGVDLNQLDHTLNFVFLPPEASGVVLTVEVNPAGPGQLAEADHSNNTATSAPLDFACKRVLELVYVPIDYRPNGEPFPNPPDPLLIEPGVGDNFIQGIYPSADWEYHRSDAESKLWTSSVAGSGAALNSALAADLQLMNPKPDFIYGWVPGGLGYNGQAQGIPGVSAMGNTEPIRHQRTAAHELGHLFGLSHNNTPTAVTGIDVEHHLNLTQALPIVKLPSLMDVMTAGLLTNQAWVWPGNYLFFLNHAKFQCVSPLAGGTDSGETLMISGLFDRAAGSVEILGALAFESGDPTPTVPIGQADLVFRVFAGGATFDAGVAVPDELESCAGATGGPEWMPLTGFTMTFPPALDPASVDGVSVVDPVSGRVLADLVRTPSAPEVDFTSPATGAALADEILVAWQARDADGDELRYYLRYSPDGERLVPLATNIAETEWRVNLAGLPAPKPGVAYLELFATDGLNTSRVRTDPLRLELHSVTGLGNRPWLYILTPDSGKSFPKGATVVLHSSGWDIEDHALSGASIVWSSNVDGTLGIGRLLTAVNLSVGNHVITARITDSTGLFASDTATIEITDRVLPGGGVTCQEDLGFGGPGSSALSLCGGDLSTGTTADLALSGAAPGQPAWLAAGFASNPTPVLGGTLVPVPIATVLSGLTDASGSWAIATIPGGGAKGDVYLQAAYVDLAQAEGFGISNAIKAVVLP